MNYSAAVIICCSVASIGGWMGSQLGATLSEQQLPATPSVRVLSSHSRSLRALAPSDDSSVEQRLQLAELVQRDDGQAMILSARAAVPKDDTADDQRGFHIQQSLAVYDQFDQTIIPAARGSKIHVARDGELEDVFEIPSGLPDGYYYAELLTAFSEEPKGHPVVSGQRQYFRVVKGEIEPMTTGDWTAASGDSPGIVISDSQVLDTATSETQQ